MHARTYLPAFGRFLTVDPTMSAVPANPQSWNRYAYVLDNPLKLTDPTGMYVFVPCKNVDDRHCKADQDAFEKARQEQLKSSDETLRKAAAAYGDLGEVNGVRVTFSTAKELDGYNGDTTAQQPEHGGEQASATYDVRILTGMRGTDLGNATVHEGEHVRNAQTYISALQHGIFDPSLNLRLYQTEMNAYMVSWAFARTNNLTLKYNGMTLKGAMPREQLRQEIDRFLRQSSYKLTPETNRCQFSPCG
jgi:uncharacterized protein RhaS with RHS repeats